MNEAHREVLKKHHMDLIRDLVVTEELLGSCYQHKLFDTYFIDVIRCQPSPTQQTTKLLELLPKRGPDAFSLFVKIIEHAYPWLSSALMSSCLEQQQPTTGNTTVTNHKLSQPDSISGLTRSSTDQADANNNNDYNGNTPRAHSVRPSEPCGNFDMAIKHQVDNFVQRQFCLSRKMSEMDKRNVENFLCKQMQKIVQRQTVLETDKAIVRQWLVDMNNKLKVYVKDQEKEINTKNQDTENSAHPEETVNLKMLERQINMVLSRVDKLDAQVTRCYEILDDLGRKKLLQSHIEDLMEKSQILYHELTTEKKKEDQMSKEIYDLTMERKTLDQKLQLKDVQLEVKSKQITSLQHDIKILKDEIDKLQKINWQHAEKEKTLDNLKDIVNELKQKRETINEENELLRLKLEVYEQENSTKSSPRRHFTGSRLSNSKTYKYKTPRKKSQSATGWKG